MRPVTASRIMARTTLDIEGPVLRDLKRLQKREGKTLGRLVSELLAEALAARRAPAAPATSFEWRTVAARVLVDLTDKEQVEAALQVQDPAPR
jgi:hypothetical protein